MLVCKAMPDSGAILFLNRAFIFTSLQMIIKQDIWKRIWFSVWEWTSANTYV